MSIQYHQSLCNIFWTDFNFDERIRQKLLSIARDFIDSVSVLEKGKYVEDIILTGSITNYNWTEQSDLDLHIKVRFEDVPNDDKELLKKFFDDEKIIWNNKHNITLRGFDVEIYIEDVTDVHITEFSLLNNKWIHKPVYSKPEVDDETIDKKVNSYINVINFYTRLIKTETDNDVLVAAYDYLKRLKEKIMNGRRSGIKETKSEFNTPNLIFKKLRNLGYIKTLVDLIIEYYDKQFVQ